MSTITRPAVQIPVQIPGQAPPVSVELSGPPIDAALTTAAGHRHGRACYWDMRVCSWVCGG